MAMDSRQHRPPPSHPRLPSPPPLTRPPLCLGDRFAPGELYETIALWHTPRSASRRLGLPGDRGSGNVRPWGSYRRGESPPRRRYFRTRDMACHPPPLRSHLTSSTLPFPRPSAPASAASPRRRLGAAR